MLERSDRVGAAWHGHYERLRLHTAKDHSALPHESFPRKDPRYPSRAEVIRYLEDYARRVEIRPVFGQDVTLARHVGEHWLTHAPGRDYRSRNLVIAMGLNRRPVIPTWPDQNLFVGSISHSSEYRNGEPYRGQRVLVVGFGNFGGEIALDLWEHGARPALAVRGPANVISRDVLGVPTQTIAILLGRLPPPIGDKLSRTTRSNPRRNRRSRLLAPRPS